MERTCKKCGNTKPIEEFGKNKFSRGGRVNTCKSCTREYMINFRKTHQSEIVAYHRAYRVNHRDIDRESCRKYRKNNSEKIKLMLQIANKRMRVELRDCYIRGRLAKSFNVPTVLLREYPKLIEIYRIHLKLKRLTKKNKKNENSNRFEKRLA